MTRLLAPVIGRLPASDVAFSRAAAAMVVASASCVSVGALVTSLPICGIVTAIWGWFAAVGSVTVTISGLVT